MAKRNYLIDFETPKVNWEKLIDANDDFVPISTASKILGVNETYIGYLMESQNLRYNARLTILDDEIVNEEWGTSIVDVKKLYECGLEFCNKCDRLLPFTDKYFVKGDRSLKHTCRQCYNARKRMAYKENPFSDKETLVYYVSNGTYVKIGITSRTMKERLKEFKTGSTDKFEVIKTEKYPSRILATQRETELHKQYKDKHVRGEWYDILKEVS